MNWHVVIVLRPIGGCSCRTVSFKGAMWCPSGFRARKPQEKNNGDNCVTREWWETDSALVSALQQDGPSWCACQFETLRYRQLKSNSHEQNPHSLDGFSLLFPVFMFVFSQNWEKYNGQSQKKHDSVVADNFGSTALVRQYCVNMKPDLCKQQNTKCFCQYYTAFWILQIRLF